MEDILIGGDTGECTVRRPSWRGSVSLTAVSCAVALMLVALACSGVARAQNLRASAPFRPGIVIVGFRPGVSRAQRNSIERAAGLRLPVALGRSARSTRAGARIAKRIGTAYVLRLGSGNVRSAVHALKRRGAVRFAEPDYLMHEDGGPNDPFFGLQWAASNTGQSVAGITGTAGADDRALAAWNITTGSQSIVIGETDSGVDYTHPDLAANVWTNPGGIGGCPAGTHGYNIITGNCNPMDDETTYGGHGTHVAGILGAVGNNGIGVTGMNWTTTILPVKWLDSTGSGDTSGLIGALDWLVQAKQAGVNVRVVNDSATFVGTAYSQALSDEIDLLGSNNVLFVTAAGNTGDNNDNLAVRRYPCGYNRPTEICVTASNQRDALPAWANYGPSTVDLAAPGDNIYSTLRNGTYGYISGGSMASPQVAGAAALVLSRADMTASSLKADILTNVDFLPSLAGLVRTGGRLDVCRAVPGCTQSTPQRFGKTSVGGSSDAFFADRKRVSRYSLAVAGAVSKLSIYLAPTSTSGQQLIKGLIYSDSSGSPATLLGTSNELVFHSTQSAGWYDLTFPSPVNLAAGNYWIGIITGANSNVAGFRYDSVSTTRAYNANSYTSGPTSTFGTASTDSEQASIYATYTPISPPSSAPVNTAAPMISGTAQSGQALTASTGSWSNAPTGYAYSWQRCDSTGSVCTSIPGATASSYPVQGADVGATLRVQVTASNAVGPSSQARSAPTAVVTAGTGTFGKTSVGGSSDAFFADRKRVSRYSLAVAGAVSKLSIYLAPTSTSGQQLIKGLIYSDSSGSPATLLGTSNELVFHSTQSAGWYDLTFPSPVNLAAGNYWIGIITGANSNVAGFHYDSVSATRAYNANSYTSGPTSTFGTASTDSEQASIYATYTPN